MSTGMSNLTEIYKSVSILKKFGVKNRNLILLHCNMNILHHLMMSI